MAKDFIATRRSVFTAAGAGGAITLTALILLESSREDVPVWLYAASTNVLGVLFGLAVVSLIWEFFVRRDHSTDLRHYLRLGSSVAKSGLQDVTPRSRLDWQNLLESANEVTVLTYSSEWLERNVYTLRDVSRTRPVTVTVAVPMKGSPYLEREARRREISAEVIAEGIAESAARAVKLWREARSGPNALHRGSKIIVLEHDIDLGYEVVNIDRTTIVTLAAPGDTGELLDRVAFVYSQSAEEYPTSFFSSYRSKLEVMNRLDEA